MTEKENKQDLPKEEKKTAKTAPKKEAPKKQELDALKAELKDAKKENERLNDILLRTVAEYDNYRKRTAREKTELYTSVAADTVGKLLPVLDSIESALASSAADDKKLTEGLKLIEKQMKKSLADIGVAEVETETFDPNLHEAVAHIEDGKLPENSVTDVFRKGYKLGETVIRPAAVKVAN